MTLTMRVIPRSGQQNQKLRESGLPPHVEQMCMDWGHWVATRKFIAQPPPKCIIGKLRTPAATFVEPPDVKLDSDIAAFNLALRAQPKIAQSVVYAMYALPLITKKRVYVKRIAGELGVSRATVYRMRDSAAKRAYDIHADIAKEAGSFLDGKLSQFLRQQIR